MIAKPYGIVLTALRQIEYDPRQLNACVTGFLCRQPFSR
jgi:hypothetical protein